MTFNIGSQQGNINNVGRDQTIYGGQHGTFTQIQDSATELAETLRRLGLAQPAAEAEAVRRELAQPQPNRESIANRLTRIAQSMTAMAGAAAAVQAPLVALAHWLGGLGGPILLALGL
ncbi:hypothetical protein LTV02_01645 [Nocardia yamanashiensis]|uniref:hypothetical protein n=1 Tax=Nocardia yamanashiensis TaxID=209247 RepID=UPI001E5BCC93|nr:hypothetical protein [Nocardia yamanashiensis]UGT42160.1 hypothetical protein LTV02_01645 [Nocardia yamanashiensis]